MSVIPLPQRHRGRAPDRFHVVSDRLCASGALTGELLDSEGATVGVCRRRRTVPAAPRPGLVPVASAIALKRRNLGSVLEEDGQPR